ncbi:hypothetical protein MOW14_14715 (plasmid) [Acinetobacter indicus]|uniref:hypothetical protein n=1 Tax=Acinetobacter indicus TaxID=756892 RepID=UPI001FA8008A|nr:hypothetical protein [Acinetobacter indicus]UNW11153.1 hypothetical protein MOW14_14715 [Acinetobacter indicus]
MKISKTTMNFADQRKFKIAVLSEKKEVRVSKRIRNKNWTLKLELNARGLFFKTTNLPGIVREEIPYWVETDKHLRDVIRFLSQEIPKIKAA